MPSESCDRLGLGLQEIHEERAHPPAPDRLGRGTRRQLNGRTHERPLDQHQSRPQEILQRVWVALSETPELTVRAEDMGHLPLRPLERPRYHAPRLRLRLDGGPGCILV